MSRHIKRPLHFLVHPLRGQDGSSPFGRVTASYLTAPLLVRLFYALTLYLIADRYVKPLQGWAALDASTLPLLWPLRWLVWSGMETAVYLLGALAVGGTVLAIFQPERRPFRLLAFVGLFLLMALNNSFGKINHSMHGWLAVSFWFIFLPKVEQERPSRSQKVIYLTIFWGAQALLLWFYTMSGVWKVETAVSQIIAGEVHAFHPYAMAHQVANRLLQDNSTSILGPFLLTYPLLGWPLYLGALYLELFAIVAAFRPSLHRLWGTSLALFHLGTFLTMSITFNQNIMLLGLLLIASPFHPPNWTWQQAVGDLPLIGLIWRRLSVQKPRGTQQPQNSPQT